MNTSCRMFVVGVLFFFAGAFISSAAADDGALAHIVFFKLKDDAPQAKTKLVEACKKHLSNHDGAVYFSVGVMAEEFDREVNDREFDVALHMVFRDKAAHDKYQTHRRHLQFIKELKDGWEKVRVFDSYLKP